MEEDSTNIISNYLGITPGIANYITQEVGEVDLSDYYTKSEVDSKIDSIAEKRLTLI